jgi:hypothetical protein
MNSYKPPMAPIAGGEDVAWDFARVKLGERRYLFFVVSARPYETSPIEQRLKQDLSTFGEDLGPYASVVRTYPRNAEIQREHFSGLSWPGRIGERISDPDWVDPLMLILDREYADFDPQQHPWAIVWLEDYNPDTLYKVFTKLARLARDPDADLIERLRRSAAESKVKSAARRLLGVFEIKPGLFGVSLNVNALLGPSVAAG